LLPQGVIHGDANVGNVLHDSDGNAVVIDLDGFAIGPHEWDLALTAIYYDSFGWHTREEYETFVCVYGFDIMKRRVARGISPRAPTEPERESLPSLRSSHPKP
jgi:aminoglycoside phosphotransferase (APT) family kinase protein